MKPSIGGRVAGPVLIEAFLVAIVGVLLAFALNAFSPRGLSLARDYFPGAVQPAPALATIGSPADSTGTNAFSSNPDELALKRLKAKGLQVIDAARVRELHQDPRFIQNQVVFVDARDDKHYQAGHIPGAYQFDHYRAPQYLAQVLPVCLSAEQVIVYCLGGDCEDSEFAAVILRQSGVANEKLAVFAGGFTAWATNGWPVELGLRGSGKLQEAKQ